MSSADILVLGSGSREHALAWRLARDESVRSVQVAPGNGGSAAAGRNVPQLNPTDPSAVARYAANQRIGLVVVGPEVPLAAGVADALEQAGVPVFGPTRAAARLESSKVFAKDQMQRAGVPTASSKAFGDVDAALAHLAATDGQLVVKADWLAAGKGVVVPETRGEAEDAVRRLFAAAPRGARLLLEERLSGREVSVFALISGSHVMPIGAACDYKRLLDGDIGPNTGGMGAYCGVPGFGARQLDETVATVFEPIAWRMERDGQPFRGVLYAGLMLTDDGPMVLEFNVRFGDPEAQVLLPMLDGDLAQALLGAATGDVGLMDGALRMRDGAAVGVVLAAEGYPGAALGGRPLDGAEPSGPADAGPSLCFHGATQRDGDRYLTTGGRVATFVGVAADLATARAEAYRALGSASLQGGQYRGDIAARELLAG